MSKIELGRGFSAPRKEPYVYARKTGQKYPIPVPQGVPLQIIDSNEFDCNQNIKTTNIELQMLLECIDYRLKGMIYFFKKFWVCDCSHIF